jgi:hypothetical protein
MACLRCSQNLAAGLRSLRHPSPRCSLAATTAAPYLVLAPVHLTSRGTSSFSARVGGAHRPRCCRGLCPPNSFGLRYARRQPNKIGHLVGVDCAIERPRP